jgi:DNA-binding NarL/FixJ family response regulator
MPSAHSAVSSGLAPPRDPVVRVAIVDDRPAVSRGLAAALAAEHCRVEELLDLSQWIGEPGRKVAMVGRRQGMTQVELVSSLRAGGGSELSVVVLLADGSVDEHRRLLVAGADGVADQNASLQHICEVVRATVKGYVLLPADVCAGVLLQEDTGLPRMRGDDREIRWLQALIDGKTVSDLAKREGYSEREMYRLLSLLYSRLGVESRTRAIVRAAQRGLVTS